MSRGFRIFLLVTVALIAAFLLLAIAMPSGSRPVSPRTQRLVVMKLFSERLFAYRSDQGSFPNKLSDLVPKYISPNEIALFYPRLSVEQKGKPIPTPLAEARNLDELCDYIYVKRNLPPRASGAKPLAILIERSAIAGGDIQAGCIYSDGRCGIAYVSKLDKELW